MDALGRMTLWLACMPALALAAPSEPVDTAFYVPENPEYTIVQSTVDSLRFTVKTLAPCRCGHLSSISSFVDPEGIPMLWHDFGPLEGPGWAANAVGGAHELYTMGEFFERNEWKEAALAVLDHVLEHGFIDRDTGLIRGYRDIPTDTLHLNYQKNSEWFCPGSMAKIAFQLLEFADTLGPDPRAARMREDAVRCAAWIDQHLEAVPNGWFARRCKPDGALYIDQHKDKDEPFWQSSADSLFILLLQSELSRRNLADYRKSLTEKSEVFMKAGGFFASINHDTYDPQENVAYSVAFRTLTRVGHVLEREDITRFAYERCLTGLNRFRMADDRNGVKTRGLLFMEDSWDTAYMWENAECALAYFEAAVELRETSPESSRRHEQDGLTILRAIAKHHYGPHGFLTEGVDWNNHVGQKHHIKGAEFGAIQYTEPLLNNQHIVEPTLYYLNRLAKVHGTNGERVWSDCEGNILHREPDEVGDGRP